MRAILCIIALICPLQASSQTISAANPESVASALHDLGYNAKLEKDADNDPVVRSSVSGANFSVYFFGCSNGSACRHLVFSSAWDRTNPASASLINEWNRKKIVGHAYIDDEGDPYLRFFVTTTGGLPADTFATAVSLWATSVGDFKNFVSE